MIVWSRHYLETETGIRWTFAPAQSFRYVREGILVGDTEHASGPVNSILVAHAIVGDQSALSRPARRIWYYMVGTDASRVDGFDLTGRVGNAVNPLSIAAGQTSGDIDPNWVETTVQRWQQRRRQITQYNERWRQWHERNTSTDDEITLAYGPFAARPNAYAIQL